MANYNKALVEAFFRDCSVKGLIESVREHGAKDVSWWICGVGEGAQYIPKISELFKEHFDVKGLVIVPEVIIAEDNYVAVEARSDSRFRNGGTYQNTYSYWFEVSDNKILSVREYPDSVYGMQKIGHILSEAFGP